MFKKLKESSEALMQKLEAKEKLLKEEFGGMVPVDNPELRTLREQ